MTTYFSPLNGSVPIHAVAGDLVQLFAEVGYTAAGLAGHLGPAATEALFRGEPAAVELATQRGSQLDLIIRAFVLHDPLSREELTATVGAQLATQLLAAAVAIPAGTASTTADAASGRVIIALDIRPHLLAGENYWVFSDIDAALVEHVPGSAHVLGVGAASLSLLQSVPRSPVESVLDLGTGSGVQLLGQLSCAQSITATDIHGRALELARATVAAASATDPSISSRVELLEGSWFAPVHNRRFDRIVSNPPFVVGLPTVGHVYRDSGLSLDGASELVVSQVADYLTEGGTAHLLAAWVHQGDIPWQQRVSSWLPDRGVRAWVIQRDEADPALYVGTWLKDAAVDGRSAAGREQARRWLEHFAAHDVHAIGFGFVAIQRIGAEEPSEVLAESMPQAFTDPLGPEVEEYFARAAWLSALHPGEFATHCFGARPGLAREDIAVSDAGFSRAALRLTRTEGPRWSHDVDTHLAAIVAGLNPHGLNLEETVELYAAAHGYDAAQLLDSAIPAIVDLVRHGLVLPAELLINT